ncbi:MAG: DUF1836 domain-containing protein [Clostridia bacterium]|nr:DUF1836 domain-containing protein [Clostridia bacterium]
MPRYSSLPNVGLYLEQVTKYVNGLLAPLSFPEVTPSMVSNYVKKGVIDAPVKKQYYPEQLAYIIFICVGKSVMAIDDIAEVYKLQKDIYSCDVAYDYFCLEFENMLAYIAGLKDTVDNIGTTNTELKNMLRSVITSAAHLIFSSFSLEQFRNGKSII